MEFSSFVITTQGQALMAKLMQGTGKCDFTAIKLSSSSYTAAQLPGLTSLSNIKQTAPITKKSVISANSVQIEGSVDNRNLSAGYNIQTIGIYANDPTNGEILYAVARATTPGYMPAFNGVTVSGGYFKFVVTVGNSNNVTITVDPAGYASIGDVQALQSEIADLKGFVGYTDSDVYGVEVDFANKRFTRLAGAVNRNAGSGFDDVNDFCWRYRFKLTDCGEEVAKYGDAAYSETGKLTMAVDLNPEGVETPDSNLQFAVGTPVQVMVKQPKFYYKVVPLVLDKIVDGIGYHLRKARYYVSDTLKPGFKVHPAFIHNGLEKDYIYLSAYEGSLFDVSADAYILDDAQVADFTATTGDKLCSIANAKPASGLTQNLTRRNCGKLAENRGTGWFQSYGALVAASQLLFLVEYASFNTQTKIGNGNVSKTDDGATSMTEITGATTNLGNASGAVTNTNNVQIVTYRGEENLWGNIWKFVDGLNIYPYGLNELYVADHAFTESKKDGHYKNAGFTLAKANGYVSAMGYSEEFDWLFFPSEVNGNGANSSVPVGDYFYQNNTYASGFFIALLGGSWNSGANAGAFVWDVPDTVGSRSRNIGGRLAYVPDVVAPEEAA